MLCHAVRLVTAVVLYVVLFMIQRSTPLMKAMSVPGRIRTKNSPFFELHCSAVRVSLGSMTIILPGFVVR